MTAKNNNVTITVKVDERVKTLLEKCSKEVGLSLSLYTRNIIYCTLNDYGIMANLKLIKLDHLQIYSQADNLDIKIYAPEIIKEVNISVILDENVKVKLEKISTDLGLTMKQVARNFIYVALYEHDLLRKLRMVQIGKIANGFMASINRVFMPQRK
jgi:antitoxin component of RelBE/YafQ-DinJ toxin-antitoxin module